LVYTRQRLMYVPHNDQLQVCSNIVQLSVVDPMGSYSHGYKRAEGKKEDTVLDTRMHEPNNIHNSYCLKIAHYHG
jgi:hypothetical protein